MHPNRRPMLDLVDPEKRATLKKLAAGAAFVGPVVASFSIGGLSIGDARAYVNPADDVRTFPANPDETAGPGYRPDGGPRHIGGN